MLVRSVQRLTRLRKDSSQRALRPVPIRGEQCVRSTAPFSRSLSTWFLCSTPRNAASVCPCMPLAWFPNFHTICPCLRDTRAYPQSPHVSPCPTAYLREKTPRRTGGLLSIPTGTTASLSHRMPWLCLHGGSDAPLLPVPKMAPLTWGHPLVAHHVLVEHPHNTNVLACHIQGIA